MMAKATNRDVVWGIRNCLVFPWFLIGIMSTLHEYLLAGNNVLSANKIDGGTNCSSDDSPDTSSISCLLPSKNDDAIGTKYLELLLESRVLLLGFSTRQHLLYQMYESFLGAVCWGICFLFIRKGCNPQFRSGFQRTYWRGACFSIISIFNGSMLRAIVKGTIFPLEKFRCCFCNNAFLPQVFRWMIWTSMECSGNDHFICNALYNACLIGTCWGITNTLIRRRLDPAMRDPRETFVRRHWKDVSFGILQLGTSSFLKSLWKHYCIPSSGALPGRYENTLLLTMYAFVSGHCQVKPEPYRHLYESMQVGTSWCITNLFIRRGLNPDFRDGGGFIKKYWQDALYGGLALSCCVLLKFAVRVSLDRVALFLANQQAGPLLEEL